MSGNAGDADTPGTVRGTREWAVAEINCSLGCPHGCRYCYARYDLVERRKILTAEQWLSTTPVEADVGRRHPLYPGQVMFPAAHDIVEENLADCMTVIENLLVAGNRVLVVSKPHLPCIEALCERFHGARQHLLFRFTITARNPGLLHLWEPHAPDYEERRKCLQYAFEKGFATSVSIEPMLDTGDVVAMVGELLPWVTHSIWLGKMNKIEERVVIDCQEMRHAVQILQKGQEDGVILEIYRQLAAVGKVRWKDSVKQVVGLRSAERPGLDV